eukprot:gnl/Spiro4/11557_TR6102_c0_g1_i1.p1 gnl/Spiro4/11557_TR6102_c0_g1~~gnl/Spiro4/11557_TR6102_c0_g1_i1.p1  ORF type:complete len:879 (+),score=138.22 gnl/Spiro4/11557_TR6102_c0_g1_i1:94-2730(+)
MSKVNTIHEATFDAWLRTNSPAPGAALRIRSRNTTPDDITAAERELAEKQKVYVWNSNLELPPHIASPFPRVEYRLNKINDELKNITLKAFVLNDAISWFFLHLKYHGWFLLAVMLLGFSIFYFLDGSVLWSLLYVSMTILLSYSVLSFVYFRQPASDRLFESLGWWPSIAGVTLFAAFLAGNWLGWGGALVTHLTVAVAIASALSALQGHSWLRHLSEFAELPLLLTLQAPARSERTKGKVTRSMVTTSQFVTKVKPVPLPIPARERPAPPPSTADQSGAPVAAAFTDQQEEDMGTSVGTSTTSPTWQQRIAGHPLFAEDQFFAEQRVAGLDPLVLRRCVHLPSGLAESPGVQAVLRQLQQQQQSQQQQQQQGGAVAGQLDYEGDHFDHELRSLETALAAGRLFECDYPKFLAGQHATTTTNSDGTAVLRDEDYDVPEALAAGRHMLLPYCLFVCDSTGVLHALAIRLTLRRRTMTDGVVRDVVIVTPADARLESHHATSTSLANRWLLAKMIAQCADATCHLAIHHLARTHFLAEPFVLATHRQLPRSHPVFQLLVPHLYQTLAINNFGRQVMVAYPDGIVEGVAAMGARPFVRLMLRSYRELDFASEALPANLRARGVDSSSKLRYYPYRDDASLVWDSVQRYVEAIVNAFYKSEADVVQDAELQAWLAELSDPIAGWPQGRVPGLVRPTDPQSLIQLLTQAIFLQTCQHSALNNPQYLFGGFVPSSPLAFYTPLEPLFTDFAFTPPPSASSAPCSPAAAPPHSAVRDRDLPSARKPYLTLEHILRSLPPRQKAAQQVAFGYFLSYSSPSPLLVNFRHPVLETNPLTSAAVAAFQKELAQLVEVIDTRNRDRIRDGRCISYEWASPSQCNISIGI